MSERIDDKAKEIEGYVSNLESYVSSNFEEYVNDNKTKDACERCFEKIVEALADLGFLVIKEKSLREPKDDIDSFVVLAENGLISVELSEKLKDAKGMRNIIAHEYGKVDDAQVFEAVKNELGKDVRKFLESVGRRR
jgi:uncharacterized protein YutE (UPF0331/DUF86 family)